jgi:transposase
MGANRQSAIVDLVEATLVGTPLIAFLDELEAVSAVVGKRFIGGGRALARKALYMAALVASRYHPSLRLFYERLRQRGKPGKVALTAIMRKLIVTANALLRHG